MFSLKRWIVTSDACSDLRVNEQNRDSDWEKERGKWIWMKSKSIRNTPPLNNPLLHSLCSSHFAPLHPVIFYSPTCGEFNKYMQMCAVEHDECKSGEDVLWALPRLGLRADPGLIIFHFLIAFNSAASVYARACVYLHMWMKMWQARVCVQLGCAGGGGVIFVEMTGIIFHCKFIQKECQ